MTDFIKDIKNTFPEYNGIIDKWWKIDSVDTDRMEKQKLFVDRYYRLHLKSIGYSDIGKYYCYFDDKLRLTVSLNLTLSLKTKTKIYIYTINTGCFFLLITLIQYIF